jgi:hypothetical protein
MPVDLVEVVERRARGSYQKCHWVPVMSDLRTRVMRKVESWMGSMMANAPSSTSVWPRQATVASS